MPGAIAIVGRPNVGKSALFNRIARRRIAIVHDEPGVTRDRITFEAEWTGRPFTLIDTGGIGLLRGEKAGDIIAAAAAQQVELALDAADVILLVVDAQAGPVALDREVALRLRQRGKPVLVVANKADQPDHDANADVFSELGFPRVFPISAIHDRGIEPLMEAAVASLPPEEARANEGGPSPLKLAIVGRPNVGKSSLVNQLTQSERLMVTPIPGTTRDAIDVPFEIHTEGRHERYVLIDTAGLRKERRIDDSVEFYSVKRTEQSIERCDIAVLVLDAEIGVNEQDKKIADKILAARKAAIIAVNKWDLFQEQLKTAQAQTHGARVARKKTNERKPFINLAEFGGWIHEQLFFLDYSPVIFISAKSGFHAERLLEAVRYVAAQLEQKIPTAVLNRALQTAVERRQPVSATGHRLKFFYATQVKQNPPTFLLFVNRDELFSDPYKRYLASELRRAFGFEGCPIVLIARARPQREASENGKGSVNKSRRARGRKRE